MRRLKFTATSNIRVMTAVKIPIWAFLRLRAVVTGTSVVFRVIRYDGSARPRRWVISTNRPVNSQSSGAEGTSFLGETADLRWL